MTYKCIIIGTAINYNECIGDKPIHSLLPCLKDKVDDIIGLNCTIIDDNLRNICTKFITIDYYTCDYLAHYPNIQDKMYIENTVKKEADKRGVLQEVKNIFKVCRNIDTDITSNNLYLNTTGPTVLQSALNLALKKGIEKGNTKEDINIYLYGISIDSQWKHHNEKIYTMVHRKDESTIENMRLSIYNFKNYLNLYTLNKDHNLYIKYKSPIDLLI